MKTISAMMTAALVALLIPAAAHAQDDAGRAVLQRAADQAISMIEFTVDFELELDAVVDSESENFVSDFTVAFDRRSGAFVHMNNRYQELYFYASPTTTTRYIPEFEQYMIEEESTSPADLINGAANSYTLPAIVIFSEMTKSNPWENVLESDEPIEMLGEAEVNGVDCDHIRFKFTDFSVDVWVEQGERALIHRVRPYLEQEIAKIAKQGGDVEKLDIDLRVMHWQPNKADDDLLVYTPDEGVEKVARFYRPAPPSPAEALVGQDAPPIELTMLDGSEFNLDDHRGSIVLLDFWATWCGPCRIGMPILNNVAKEFEDKGVKLFAVNLQDDASAINSFLESSDLEGLSVVMDTDGVTMEPYKAMSIPQMVVVGKDGVVKKVHVGITPNYEEDMRKELTALTSE